MKSQFALAEFGSGGFLAFQGSEVKYGAVQYFTVQYSTVHIVQ